MRCCGLVAASHDFPKIQFLLMTNEIVVFTDGRDILEPEKVHSHIRAFDHVTCQFVLQVI